jgi:pyruvate dehydrogenase E2 component (dihydrolipoamide acetyltransferase)
MDRLQKFPMPDVGEGLTEAEVLEWKVGVGDTLTVNQIMVEIETAKAAVELPSPFAGTVHALLVEPGVTVDVGTPIIVIDTQPGAADVPGGAPVPTEAAPAAQLAADNADTETGAKIGEVAADGRTATLVGYIPAAGSGARRPRKPVAQAPASVIDAVAASFTGTSLSATHPAAEPVSADAPNGASNAVVGPRPAEGFTGVPLATPPVRKLAKDLGIDLTTVAPKRADGVITRADLEAVAGVSSSGVAAAPTAAAVGYDPATREHRIPIKGVRKMTAEAMVRSAFTAPHVTEFLTVDVTPMIDLRDRLRLRPEFSADGVKLTPLTFVARAVCLAARRTPEINAVWDEAAGEIVLKQYVHLGIAAATPRGLIVPNIRDADALDLRGLAAAITRLTEVARSGKTPPADMTGGTFTITNVGVFGVDTGTPIINPGETAILALGSVKDAPWVVDGQLAVRKVCQLALSFDHRVVDGHQGSTFLAEVGALLADPALALTY